MEPDKGAQAPDGSSSDDGDSDSDLPSNEEEEEEGLESNEDLSAIEAPETDEDLQKLVDALVQLEVEAVEVQEELEEEPWAELRRSVTKELQARKIEGNALLEAIEDELEAHRDQREQTVASLQRRSAKLQEVLEAFNIPLGPIYVHVDSVLKDQSEVNLWKEGALRTGDHSKECPAWKKQADAELQQMRPMNMVDGRMKNGGASGYLKRTLNKVTRLQKQAVRGVTEEEAGEDCSADDEHDSTDEAEAGEAERILKGSKLFKGKSREAIKEEAKDDLVIQWKLRYAATTPQDAADLLNAEEVEELDELKEDDDSETHEAFQAENETGLNEKQRRSIRKVHDSDDVDKIRSFRLKQAKPRKPRQPRMPGTSRRSKAKAGQTGSKTPIIVPLVDIEASADYKTAGEDLAKSPQNSTLGELESKKEGSGSGVDSEKGDTEGTASVTEEIQADKADSEQTKGIADNPNNAYDTPIDSIRGVSCTPETMPAGKRSGGKFTGVPEGAAFCDLLSSDDEDKTDVKVEVVKDQKEAEKEPSEEEQRKRRWSLLSVDGEAEQEKALGEVHGFLEGLVVPESQEKLARDQEQTRATSSKREGGSDQRQPSKTSFLASTTARASLEVGGEEATSPLKKRKRDKQQEKLKKRPRQLFNEMLTEKKVAAEQDQFEWTSDQEGVQGRTSKETEPSGKLKEEAGTSEAGRGKRQRESLPIDIQKNSKHAKVEILKQMVSPSSLGCQSGKVERELSRGTGLELGAGLKATSHCTACGKKRLERSMELHPMLGVSMCRRCYERYDKCAFDSDEEGWEEACRWCADGGQIVCCDTCKFAFCERCIQRNFGKDKLSGVLSPQLLQWSCFLCDPGQMADRLEIAEEDCDGKDERAAVAEISSDSKEGGHQTLTQGGKSKRKNIRAVQELNMEEQRIYQQEEARIRKLAQLREAAAIRDSQSPLKKQKVLKARKVQKLLQLPESEDHAEEELVIGLGEEAEPVPINLARTEDEEPVHIAPAIATHLRPYQLEGVRFLWDSCIESVEKVAAQPKGDKDKATSGCILAHNMGLGKTFQVVTFVHTLLTHPRLQVRTVLIVVPVNVLHNWRSEFREWQKACGYQAVKVFLVGEACNTNLKRAETLEAWRRKGGVCLISYSTFRNLSAGKTVKDKELAGRLRESLQDPGPDILVCDEAHIIKNHKAGVTQTLKKVRTRRRIALTGSPLQNNLEEYFCMVDFVREGLLGSLETFRNRFANPITNGLCSDSTRKDVMQMKRRSHVLTGLLKGFVQRKDMSEMVAQLPPRNIYVISVRLSPLQKQLYLKYLEDVKGLRASAKKNMLFEAYSALSKVWNHPNCLWVAKDSTSKDADVDNDLAGVEAPDEMETVEAGSVTKRRQKKTSTQDFDSMGVHELKAFLEKAKVGTEGCLEKEDLVKLARNVKPVGWWEGEMSAEERSMVENGGKMVLLLELLKAAEAEGDKMLVFSQSLSTLSYIEQLLSTLPTAEGSGWEKGTHYYRLDGRTPASARQKLVERFNDPQNTAARCVLISTKAGSLGINLPGANRVVIMDGSWNPTHDLQAMFRAWRYGQKKPVYVYRLLACGTMEEKIYGRQVVKEGLAARVVDEHQVGRVFSVEELDNLFTFDEDGDDYKPEEPPPKPKPRTPAPPRSPAKALFGAAVNAVAQVAAAVGLGGSQAPPPVRGVMGFSAPDDAPPKDGVLARLLLKHRPKWIVRYHEHDVLLEDKEEEKLTEEEKKEAWSLYQQDTNPVPPAPPGPSWAANIASVAGAVLGQVLQENNGQQYCSKEGAGAPCSQDVHAAYLQELGAEPGCVYACPKCSKKLGFRATS